MIPHKQFVWYESDKGEIFRLVGEVPTRTFQSTRHAAMVQRRDGTFTFAIWDSTKIRKVPGWFGRLKEKMFGRPAGFPGPSTALPSKEGDPIPSVVKECSHE